MLIRWLQQLHMLLLKNARQLLLLLLRLLHSRLHRVCPHVAVVALDCLDLGGAIPAAAAAAC
jgi:hypothetical protein